MPPPPLPSVAARKNTAQHHPATRMVSYERDGSCVGDCSSQSCDGGCSLGHCPPSCDGPSCEGSQLCEALDPCTSLGCAGSPACVDNSCPWTSLGHVPASGNDFSDQAVDTGPTDSMHCRWLMPDQQCDVSVPTIESLGQHVFHEHIEPQGTFTCPIDQCAERIDAQQAPSHLTHAHYPVRYVCLHSYCRQEYPDVKQLQHHMDIAHKRKNVACHWAGCEVFTNEVSQLKSHVDIDHLHFPGVIEPPMSPYTFQTPMYAGQDPALHIPTHSTFTSSHTSPVNLEQTPFLQGSIISPYQNALPSPMSSDPRAYQNDAIPQYPTDFMHPLGLGEEGSRCMWITDKSTGHVCGMTFHDGNELQLHVDQEHVWTRDGNTTGIVLLCHWQDCKRGGKPLQNKEKLRRHIFTHTGCRCSCELLKICILNPVQIGLRAALSAESHSITLWLLRTMSVYIRVRSHLPAKSASRALPPKPP